MKKKLFVAVMILGFIWGAGALAGEVHLKWDANSEPDIVGYKVYVGTSSGGDWFWQEIGDVNGTEFIYDAPEDGLYLFRVSAYDSEQETIRLKSGLFYNALWSPIKAPADIGME